MASFKKLWFTLLEPRTRNLSYPFTRPRIHFLVVFFLLLSLFLISSSLTDHSSTATHTTLSSPYLSASNYTIDVSAITSSNTHFVSDVQSNCTLNSITTAVEKSHGIPRNAEPDMISDLASCNIFDGNWILDASDPVYQPGSCPYLDDAFNCFKNGRPDSYYLRYRWKPHGCHIPRFDGRKMLGILRGKRLVFVGDSLNRNMWQSLVCALRESVKDKSKIHEVSTRREFRTQGFNSFKFRDYNCSIEFIKSPFLVQEWRGSNREGVHKETLRLDMIQASKSQYHDADIIIFNTGHWWNHQKTCKGKDYFQEGNHVYNIIEVSEAFTKALRTWAKWVDSNVDSNRTRVFFRGYSASHYRGGQWNSGGNCDGETHPITNVSYLGPYPWMMSILETVIAEMKTPVFYLNITKMSDYRKDGHPSIYRQPGMRKGPRMFQDCSHWCLPGIPDSWNELLYATLLISHKYVPVTKYLNESTANLGSSSTQT